MFQRLKRNGLCGQTTWNWLNYSNKRHAVRREKLFSAIRAGDAVLEIGPFTNPNVMGPNVKYFDVLSKSDLIERAKSAGYPIVNAVDIDFVSASGDLSIVGENFDIVISSHCIEHQPDLIRHFRNVSELLRPGGRYLIVAPDKRYCFDHFIPPSAVFELVEAFDEQRKLHTMENVVRHIARTTHNDASRHWSGDHGEPGSFENPALLERARRAFEEHRGEYFDVHAWQFTPSTFREAIELLHRYEYLPLVPMAVYETPRNSFEFCAVLTKVR